MEIEGGRVVDRLMSERERNRVSEIGCRNTNSRR